MWTLIVITTLWVHGTTQDASIYSFYAVNSEARCVQLKAWIDNREKQLEHTSNKVTTQCVKEN